MDGVVTGVDPQDLRLRDHLRRQAQSLGSEPQPDPPRRTGLGEAVEDRGDCRPHGFVGVQSDFAIGVAPDQSDRQAAPEFPTRRLVPDPTVEAGAKDIELRFAYRTFHPQQEAIIEQRRVINPVRVADQSIGQTAQINETIPVSIVTCQARHLKAQNEPHVSESDLGGQPSETGSRHRA